MSKNNGYNGDVDPNTGPVCPEQFFRNIRQPVKHGCITDAALLLNDRALAVARMLSYCGQGTGFALNHQYIENGLQALEGILEQQEAVLSHREVKP